MSYSKKRHNKHYKVSKKRKHKYAKRRHTKKTKTKQYNKYMKNEKLNN